MIWRTLAALGLTVLMIEPSLASETAGMPWEGPLDTIKNSLTGPTAMIISLLGVAAAGGTLIFGGELGEFMRRIIMLVLVISLLVTSASLLTTLFGSTSALIL